MKELESAGVLNNTLIIMSSDNGSPFINGRTNLYDSGIREPFLISNPININEWGQVETKNLQDYYKLNIYLNKFID